MFKNPFSFQGRIRRTEYGITLIIGTCINILSIFISFDLFIIFAIIPLCWFLWAQGAKRCHDMEKSGWYQVIPFYPIIMIFVDGTRGNNIYGPDPKNSMDFLMENSRTPVYSPPVRPKDNIIPGRLTFLKGVMAGTSVALKGYIDNEGIKWS